LLLLMPAGGDDLQGIKRGIMELADLIVVNKSDGDLEAAAGRTTADYAHALRLMQPRHKAWSAEVLKCSAASGAGIGEACEKVEAFGNALRESGELAEQRRNQAVLWFNRELSLAVMDRLAEDADLARRLGALERQVAEGDITPGAAARRVLAAWRAG
jgi:LAO/AO transport system kinase